MSDAAISGGKEGHMVSNEGHYMSDEGVESPAGHPGHTLGSVLVTARTGTGQFQFRSQPRGDPVRYRPVVVSSASEPVTC